MQEESKEELSNPLYEAKASIKDGQDEQDKSIQRVRNNLICNPSRCRSSRCGMSARAVETIAASFIARALACALAEGRRASLLESSCIGLWPFFAATKA